jgi:lysophospholipase L1-like esterase
MEIDEGFVTPEQFEQAYRDLLTKLQLAHVVVWIGLEPNEYNPTARDALLDYNARARNVARSFNLPVLDLMETFPQPAELPERPELGIDTILTIGAREKRGWNDYEAARQAGGFTYTFDGLHLTPESAKQTAEWIAAFIRSN